MTMTSLVAVLAPRTGKIIFLKEEKIYFKISRCIYVKLIVKNRVINLRRRKSDLRGLGI